jgi:hypothetical protein
MLLRRQVRKGKSIGDSFVCDNGIRFQTCLAFSWERGDFERTFLEIAESVQQEYAQARVERPDPTELESIVGRLDEVETQTSKLLDLYQRGLFDVERLTPRVAALKKEKAELEAQKVRAEGRLTGVSEVQFRLDLQEFFDADLNDPKGRDVLAGVIGRLFTRIDVFHAGLPSRFQQLISARRRMVEQGKKGIQVYHKMAKETSFLQERFFLAHFVEKGVKPCPDFLTDELFLEMFDDPKSARVEFRELLRLAKATPR